MWCPGKVNSEITEVGPPPEPTSVASESASPASEFASTPNPTLDPCAGVKEENKTDILRALAIGTQIKNKQQIEQFTHLLNCYNKAGKHIYSH